MLSRVGDMARRAFENSPCSAPSLIARFHPTTRFRHRSEINTDGPPTQTLELRRSLRGSTRTARCRLCDDTVDSDPVEAGA